MKPPAEPPLRVLASPAFQNRRTNPYNARLYTALGRLGTEVAEFTKKRLLLERWHVVHLHWPDGALDDQRSAGAAVRVAYLLAKLLYAKARGAKIVWTVHNLQAHQCTHPRLERLLWQTFVPLVDAAISLSRSGVALATERFPALARRPHFVIPHGHYRDCYPNTATRKEARAKLGLPSSGSVVAFVGQIKPYKNVPALVRAFLDQPARTGEATLLVAGKPGAPSLADELTVLTEGRADVVCRFGHLAGDEMQQPLNACDLAVFPYREILNSGSAILALSFNRPVLVPAKGAMAELRELVGPEWVMTYEGELTGPVLREALRWATETTRPAECPLGALDWETVAAQTFTAYHTIVDETFAPAPRRLTETAPLSTP